MTQPLVEEVMTNLVVTFRSEERIGAAAHRLLTNRISGGPVVERGKVIGVLSESDIARALLPAERLDERAVPVNAWMYLARAGAAPTAGIDPRDQRVEDCMTRDAITVGPKTTLWMAARLIARRGIKRLPVVDEEGYLVGILARADIVRALTEAAS